MFIPFLSKYLHTLTYYRRIIPKQVPENGILRITRHPLDVSLTQAHSLSLNFYETKMRHLEVMYTLFCLSLNFSHLIRCINPLDFWIRLLGGNKNGKSINKEIEIYVSDR